MTIGRGPSDIGDAAAVDRRSQVQAFVLVGLLTAALLLFGVQLVLERQRELDRAGRSVRNVAAAVTEHADQAISNVASELAHVVVSWQDARSPALTSVAPLLRAVRASTPFVAEVFVLDPAGTVVAAASPVATGTPSYVDSELFGHHRNTPTSSIFISDPAIGAVGAAAGLPVVHVSRRMTGPDGTFRGVVVVNLSIEPMRALYNSLDLGVGGVVTLFRADGLVLVRVPAGGPIGASIGRTDFFTREIAGRSSGVFELTSPLDGVVRLTAFNHDEARRLLVTVGIARDEVLRDWTRRATAAIVAAVLLLALLSVAYRQRVKGLRSAERRARESARRFRHLADASADLTRAATVAEILERVTAAACLVVPASRAGIEVMAGRLGLQRHEATRGTERSAPVDPRVTELRALLGRDVLSRGTPICLTHADIAALPAWRTDRERGDASIPRGWLAVPLVDGEGRSFGLLDVVDRTSGEFNGRDQALLEQLARMAAASLERRRLSDDMGAALAAAQEARAEAERGRLDLIEVFDTTTDAFYSLDHEWRFTFVNAQAEQVLRRRRQEMLGRVVWDVFPQAVGTALQEELHRAARERVAREFRFHSDRLQRWLDVRVFPHESGLSVYFRDVTEQVVLDAQMHQAQKMDAVGQLTGGIAHDFNNLLTVILGGTDALVESLDDAELKSLAETTRVAAEKAAELTQRLLAFSRRQPLAPRVVDIADLVARLEGLMRRTLGEHIEIRINRAPACWPAMVDPSQLESAILNLAINARDAMPEGGSLTIEVANARLDEDYTAVTPDAEVGDYVRVTVADTGVGMSPEVAARAFEPFFTTKDVGRGSGLGLSMVYGFARQSGGHVAIHSQPGEGTRVELYLPRATATGSTSAPPPADERAPGGSEVVALVEDQALVRRQTETLLRGLGYQVESFPDGPSLLARLDLGFRPDVLLTDVVLPGGMNGRVLASSVVVRVPRLAVLYMSGYSRDTLMHDGRLDPGVQLLAKPFRKLDLARKLRAVLDAGRGGAGAAAR